MPESSPPKIHGIIAYLVTPFDSAGAVDTPRLTTLVERLTADGVHAVAPLGSTGELAYLYEASSKPSSIQRSPRSTAGCPSSSAYPI